MVSQQMQTRLKAYWLINIRKKTWTCSHRIWVIVYGYKKAMSWSRAVSSQFVPPPPIGVYPLCPGQIPTTGPCQSWPPNNPHPLDWLWLSLLSTCSWCVGSALAPVSLAAAASSKWMLHIGGGWGETTPLDCKALWVYSNMHKALYKCIIHSFKQK